MSGTRTVAGPDLAAELAPDAYRKIQDSLDEPAADALLGDADLIVRERIRNVVAEQVAPRAEAADHEHRFVHESYQALATAGLAGLIFPKSLGGTGHSNVCYALAVEEIAAGCAATSLVYMTQMHAAYPIYARGSGELAQRYVPDLLSGRCYGSLAVTEPEAGSDAAAIRSVAVRTAAGYRLRGAKTFITTGDRADVIICFATVDRARGRDGITAFVVDGTAEGLRRGTPMHKMGMHGSTTAELFFDDVPIPFEQRLGDEGDGWKVLTSSVTKSRISAAAQGVGIARAAYARTLTALKSWYGPRVPDEATHALAALRTRLLQGRLLVLSVAGQIDRTGTADPAQIAMMKLGATDLGWETARGATKILGPYGDLAALGVERCLRDAKITQIYDGTNEIQRMLIARHTAGLMKNW